MLIMIFDTETNGLPPKNATFHNSNAFPYILQLSYLIIDSKKGNITDKENDIIKIPEHISIPEVVSNINKLTKEICEENGKQVKEVLEKFLYNLTKVDVLVAHNYNFDKLMLLAELKRNNLLTNIIQQKMLNGYCTMENGTNLCKLPRHYHTYNNASFKYPKLVELYHHLFIKNINNPIYLDETKLHDALADVVVTARCYFKMNDNIDIYEKFQDYKKLFDEKVYLC